MGLRGPRPRPPWQTGIVATRGPGGVCALAWPADALACPWAAVGGHAIPFACMPRPPMGRPARWMLAGRWTVDAGCIMDGCTGWVLRHGACWLLSCVSPTSQSSPVTTNTHPDTRLLRPYTNMLHTGLLPIQERTPCRLSDAAFLFYNYTPSHTLSLSHTHITSSISSAISGSLSPPSPLSFLCITAHHISPCSCLALPCLVLYCLLRHDCFSSCRSLPGPAHSPYAATTILYHHHHYSYNSYSLFPLPATRTHYSPPSAC